MWQARPVFISSTFVDMQAERDHLRTRVFPELEEKLRARRHNLEWVDLRVGVATASQRDEHVRELHVLKVCLEEVRQCRPFLIVLLGDRYGWVPAEDRIKAAAEEIGYSADVAGRSVTDLEIDFGVLSDPEQQPRSIFYFRDSLPYANMPPQIAALYSEACDRKLAEADRADRVSRLATLKRRIEQELPTRVRHYAAQWDAEHQCVTGLDKWGRMVRDDIWSELDAETRAAAAAGDIPWQRAEREALEDFVDDRARDFVGRHAIIARLTSVCLSPAGDSASTGICVTGDPGSGKSALFGEIDRPPKPETKEGAPENRRRSSGGMRRLGGSDVFLLAHAAGASIQAPMVDTMLRRWIDELATALGKPDVDLAENADAETVERTFASLLAQMASQQRVVVLVDALDQFENTTRARFVTWLPRLWPANARLIATAIAGDASKALVERPGMEALSLPPLDAAEARSIIEGICHRYHRTFEPEVIDALLAKTGPAGPAWGNPLWLVIAVEELNLLDADDFDRARTYGGTPGEQLRALMQEHIAEFPSDIPGLYAHTFKRAEKLFGASLAGNFLGLIAVGRAGWRESDFRILLPRASGDNWDELQFAQLRRTFRGQMRRRGALSRWDFNHEQMRAAVRARLPARSIPAQHLHTEHDLHTMIADRLLSCSPDDPLHISETMLHLLASEEYARAAGYYGGSSLSEAEVRGATRVLADAVIAPATGDPASGARKICRLLDAPAPDADTQFGVANRFSFDLSDPLETSAPVDARLVIAGGTKEAYKRLLRGDPNNAEGQRGLSVAQIYVGEALLEQGNLAGALEAYRACLAIVERLAQADHNNAGYQRDLSVAHKRIGDVLVAQGNLVEALAAKRASLKIAENLSKADRGNGGLSVVHIKHGAWQADLSVAQVHVADVLQAQGNLTEALVMYGDALATTKRLAKFDPNNDRLQRTYALTLRKIGKAFEAQGNLVEALAANRASLAITERAAVSNPADARWQHDLSVSQARIGDVCVAQGNLTEALTAFRAALSIDERLAKADPTNSRLQRDLSATHEHIGDVLMMQRNLVDALAAYRADFAIAERLVTTNPGNPGLQRDLSVSHGRIGDVFVKGDLTKALAAFRASLIIVERLAETEPSNAGWQHDLSVSLEKIGDVLKAQGELTEALATNRQAREIRERLAKADPSNAGLQLDLAISHQRIGSILESQGQLVAAQREYKTKKDIMGRLVKIDPGNVVWERHLRASNMDIADTLVAQGHHVEALVVYRANLAAEERVATADPTNAYWQRDVYLTLHRVARLEISRNDLVSALHHLRRSLEILESMAKVNPAADAERQSDLSLTRARIGDVLLAQGNRAEALAAYHASLVVAEQLSEADPSNVRWLGDMLNIHWRLAKLGDDSTRRFRLIVQAIRRLKAKHVPTAGQTKLLAGAETELKLCLLDETAIQLGLSLAPPANQLIDAIRQNTEMERQCRTTGNADGVVNAIFNQARFYAKHVRMPAAALSGILQAQKLAQENGLSTVADKLSKLVDEI